MAHHKYFITLIFICMSFSINAQSLKFNGGFGKYFLISQTDKEGENTPFEQEVEYPSFEYFFDDASALRFDVRYQFSESEDFSVLFFIGLDYQYSKHDGKSLGDLGTKLTMTKFTPYLGFGTYNESRDFFMYGFVGMANGYPSSTGDLQVPITDPNTNIESLVVTKAEFVFSSTTAFRVGFGLDSENIFGTSFMLGFRGHLEFGSGNWEKVKVTYQNVTVDVPVTGESEIHDNGAVFSITLGYEFDFSG